MTDVDVSSLDNDMRSRARTPFQWDDSVNAGFSKNPKTWLPVAENYTELNVKKQESQEMSNLKIFQKLMKLRHHPVIRFGKLETIVVKQDKSTILLFKRELDDYSCMFVVALNLSEQELSITLTSHLPGIPQKMEVIISSEYDRIG